MSKISHAIFEIHQLDRLAERNQWVNRLHPLVKFVVTVFYIALVVSFDKYDVLGLAGMVIYPIAGFILADLSVRDSFKRLRIVLPLVCLIGVFNPFFDRIPVELGGIRINAGVLSMVTLMMKGVFSVLASYLLISTTSIEKLCYAFRLLHVPRMLVNQILLSYRYVTLLMEEVNRTTQAYALRAPKQKGVHRKAWGSLVGQLLLRSMDRAGTVYESMTLRGYNGEFRYWEQTVRMRWQDVVYLLIWCGILMVFRWIPVMVLAGNLFGRLFG